MLHIRTGFDVDTPDDFGRTCLHAAAAGGWVTVALTEILLMSDLSSVCPYKCLSRNLECLNLLLKVGADFNRKDNFGR